MSAFRAFCSGSLHEQPAASELLLVGFLVLVALENAKLGWLMLRGDDESQHLHILERHFGGFYRKRSEKGAFVVVEQVPLELQVEREVEVLREFRITNCGCGKNVEMPLCWRTPPPPPPPGPHWE